MNFPVLSWADVIDHEQDNLPTFPYPWYAFNEKTARRNSSYLVYDASVTHTDDVIIFPNVIDAFSSYRGTETWYRA